MRNNGKHKYGGNGGVDGKYLSQLPYSVKSGAAIRYAAIKRLEKADGLPMLPETDEAIRLANHLVAIDVVPKKAPDDALHVAIATVCGMDYLLTWNMRHLYNPDRIERLYTTIREMGYKPTALSRPDELLEAYDGA